MAGVPSRVGLTALAEELGRVVPRAVVGVVHSTVDRRVAVLCCHPHGMVQFLVSGIELPDFLHSTAADACELGPDAIDARAQGAIGALLRRVRARRLVSMMTGGADPGARFWVASPSDDGFTEDQLSAVRRAAGMAQNLIDAPLPPDQVSEQQRRRDIAGELLPAFLRARDVREVFERLAEVAARVLPNDTLCLHLFSDDLTAVQTVTRVGGTTDVGAPAAYSGAAAVADVWDFEIVDDHDDSRFEAGTLPVVAGTRASLRLVVRLDDRVIGGLTIGRLEAPLFSDTDIIVGRRLADCAAVALSHRRLAEETERVTALRDRTANLEVLDGLLATLTGVLDVRQVFDRVSAIAQRVLPHDAMSISEIIDEGEKVRIHASHGLGRLHEPYDMVIPDPTMVREAWDYRLLKDVYDHPVYDKGPGWAAGMRSMLFVSIRMEDRNWGGLNFYSKAVGHFVHDDVLVARRITDHVALALSHRRLAEEARRSEELRARTTSLELLDDLLASLADTGELGDVLAKVSGVVRRVLTHDAAALMVRQPDSTEIRFQAVSGFPPAMAADGILTDERLARTDWDHEIVDDLAQDPGPLARRLSSLGFRSLIGVPIRLERFVGALMLASTRDRTFKQADVLVVRRMADRLAVTLARDREVAASQRADEATSRAARLEARVRTLTEELDARTGYRRVVGESKQWRQVLTQAAQVAATETTVLLLGESGTGKEVVARFLHRGSARSRGPFVALNCAALPEQLLEAELFGYERGAFTGANQSKPGHLEQASGGTLFLDEVAEMSATAQPKFLRVLQEREFQRLGGTRVLRTDARIVAATNRDLQRSILNGQFREDLYYRLHVFAIRLPPLRERRDDILPLSEAFIAEIGRGLGRPPAGISRDAREVLLDYGWPGNVRELRNVLERAAILCDGGLIAADHFALNVVPALSVIRESATVREATPRAPDGAPVVPSSSPMAAPDGDLNSVERAMIERALQDAKFNKSKAAKTLGLTRHQLYIRLRKHGLE